MSAFLVRITSIECVDYPKMVANRKQWRMKIIGPYTARAEVAPSRLAVNGLSLHRRTNRKILHTHNAEIVGKKLHHVSKSFASKSFATSRLHVNSSRCVHTVDTHTRQVLVTRRIKLIFRPHHASEPCHSMLSLRIDLECVHTVLTRE